MSKTTTEPTTATMFEGPAVPTASPAAPAEAAEKPTLAPYEATAVVSRDAWRALWRGRRIRDGHAVLIKVPASAGPGELAIGLGLLESEVALLRGLEVPGVPRLVEVDRSRGNLALVLDDPGGVPLDSGEAGLVPGGAPLDRFFAAALGLCDAVGALHRVGVTALGLAPAGVLFEPGRGQVALVDLAFAAHGAGGSQPALRRDLGRLPFLAPEQTGRLNRGVDDRADFYTLGVLYHLLLAGRPPFVSSDPLELVHWHIARTPPTLSDLRPAVPAALSAIVLKLLAKTPEDRYQSARGLRADLEEVAAAWRAAPAGNAPGAAAPFQLGRHDVPERFVVPQKLYGREREVTELLAAFDEVCAGRQAPSSLMLVAGYSGIGKTSLIQEMYRPIARQRGYFVSGKFDQVARNVPFGALIQAFRALVRQLLTESEARLAGWRARVLEAVGANAAVVAEVIPEIELVIGKQPAPAVLGAAEAQNRFQLVFQNFVGALARQEHPLAVFLDDLQWADAATLGLLPALLGGPSAKYLFFMGAYRDNEVDERHPLTRTLAGLRASGGSVRRLALGPLEPAALTRLVADTLRGDPGAAAPLGRLVFEKTAGNPFFAIQFLKMLEQERFLKFDHARGAWSYDLDEIAGASITDNVIDLMTRKIQRLGVEAQRALTLASCLGGTFDAETLGIVSERSADEAARELEEAVREGLIRRRDGEGEGEGVGGDGTGPARYAFVHDRVQQAAYALIPGEQKRTVHLTAGRLLTSRLAGARAEERVFDIVNHLNLGSVLIVDPAERRELARLNLVAGQKAKSATAHDAALGYFRVGTDLLGPHGWQSDHEVAFALHMEAAESHGVCGNFEEAEQTFAALLAQPVPPLDEARIHRLRTVLYEKQSRYAEALASARAGLALMGVTFPTSEEEQQAALEEEIVAIRRLLGGRPIAALEQLPVMTDPNNRMVMAILTTIWSPAYISGQQVLTRLISATMVRLSLAHGNTEESAYGYATHAITVGPLREDYEAAFAWGSLAVRLNERLGDSRNRAKICQQFHAHALLWCRPLRECVAYAREACRSGLENGDFTYAIYGAYTETWVAIVIAVDLAAFVRDYTPNLALFMKMKVASVGDGQTIMLNWARALLGQTRGPTSLSTETFDEAGYLRTYADNPFFTICWVVTKLQLCLLHEEGVAAAEAVQVGDRIVGNLAGTIWPVVYDFWSALWLASTLERGAGDAAIVGRVRRAARSLARLAGHCAETYACWAELVAAEVARIEDRPVDAVGGFERALAAAASSGMVHHEALCSERFARFWLGRGQRRMAAVLLGEARRGYARWGAVTKVEALSRRHADLLGDAAAAGGDAVDAGPARIPPGHAGAAAALSRVSVVPAPANAPDGDPGAFDRATVMKAAQVIAGEIELTSLLGKLLRITIENAGAERGSLLLERGGEAFVVATGSLDGADVNVASAAPLAVATDLPVSLVNYVRRTFENVVLADAGTDDRAASDPYVARVRPRSVMCIPIISQGRPSGVLYLENNQVTGAFTAERIAVCLTLASQAAISLENARLFAEMKQEVARRTAAEDELRAALGEVESLKNRLQAENVYLQEEIRREHNFEEMVGGSPLLLDVLRKVEQVAPTDSTVLILGETGTGKELVARALHDRSRRAERPLVKVNCASIATGLVESELFGHLKGAFTGALQRRAGRFELADGGTIFLDEVGELPLDTQAKLLRVLQEHEFEPVGSSRTQRVDVRVIAATNRDLAEAVRAGRFRADLLYRLNVFPIRVPALRERRDDIPLLVSFFADNLAKKMGKTFDGFGAEDLERLVSWSWPGNVRELQNIVERAAIVASGRVLRLEPGALVEEARSAPDAAGPPAGGGGRTIEEIERDHIVATLRSASWVIEGSSGAAAILGLHPNTLRSRMKKLGIVRARPNQS